MGDVTYLRPGLDVIGEIVLIIIIETETLALFFFSHVGTNVRTTLLLEDLLGDSRQVGSQSAGYLPLYDFTLSEIFRTLSYSRLVEAEERY